MTEVKTRKYVTATFLFPGSLFPEESEREVDTKDPKAVAKLAPKGAFCFVLQGWVTKTTTVNGEDFEKTERDGKGTGRFYLGGTVYTLAQLKAKFGSDPDKRILISNIEGNDWGKAIQCRTGNWQPFTDQDVLLDIAA
jgi:hypothetical protein